MSRRPAMPTDHDSNQYRTDFDRIVAERPPEIIWRKKNNGILIAVSVQEWTPERVNRPASRKSDATHCGQGHELTEDNTYVTPVGYRQCRTCKHGQQRAKRRAATIQREDALIKEILASRDAARGEI